MMMYLSFGFSISMYSSFSLMQIVHSWYGDSGKRVFVILADAGMGKSAFAASLIQTL